MVSSSDHFSSQKKKDSQQEGIYTVVVFNEETSKLHSQILSNAILALETRKNGGKITG